MHIQITSLLIEFSNFQEYRISQNNAKQKKVSESLLKKKKKTLFKIILLFSSSELLSSNYDNAGIDFASVDAMQQMYGARREEHSINLQFITMKSNGRYVYSISFPCF